MEELQLTLTSARFDQRNYGVMLSNWRVGQVLNALVVDARPNSAVLLSVGGKQFVATTDIPVQPGTRMALEVKQVGEEVVLKRIQDQVAQSATASGRAAETTLTLSSARPSVLLNQLAAQPAKLGSPDFQAAVRDLLGRSVRGDNLTPSKLAHAFKHSGLFVEANLAEGRTQQAAQSPKTSLSQLQTLALALADDAEEASAESRVLRQIGERAGAMLQGIAQNQLASLPVSDTDSRWVFTLPVQVGEHFHDVRLQFDREADSEDSTDERWSASLELDLPHLGPVTIKIALIKGSVSVHFICNDPASSKVLDNAMTTLETRLQQRDIAVAMLQTEVVSSPARPVNTAEDDSAGVDIKA